MGMPDGGRGGGHVKRLHREGVDIAPRIITVVQTIYSVADSWALTATLFLGVHSDNKRTMTSSFYSTPFTYSVALFNPKEQTFSRYHAAAVEFGAYMSSAFPNARFVAHVQSSIDVTDIVAACRGRCVVHAYSFTSRKRGVAWLVGAMRFRTLWEDDGPVVVMDIHDDFDIQIRELRKLWNTMTKRGADVGVTYWPSHERECANGTALPGRLHRHTDAGLLVWKDGGDARKATRRRCFVDFCSDAVQKLRVLPRGVDEMLLDEFMTSCGVYGLPTVVFKRHVHAMRHTAPQKESHEGVASSPGAPIHTMIDTGKPSQWVRDMYVCAETRK